MITVIFREQDFFKRQAFLLTHPVTKTRKENETKENISSGSAH